jgi:hypothetical protein
MDHSLPAAIGAFTCCGVMFAMEYLTIDLMQNITERKGYESL